MADHFAFADLLGADLIVDAVYEGGEHAQSVTSDPLSRLLPIRNIGGFRPATIGGLVKYAVLYTSGRHPDWPDHLDLTSGRFTYYGDNREPGKRLHSPMGNALLRESFDAVHRDPPERSAVAPFLIFSKAKLRGMWCSGVWRCPARRACPKARTWWRNGAAAMASASRTTARSSRCSTSTL